MYECEACLFGHHADRVELLNCNIIGGGLHFPALLRNLLENSLQEIVIVVHQQWFRHCLRIGRQEQRIGAALIKDPIMMRTHNIHTRF